MTVAAYRDRSTGQYPLTIEDVQGRVDRLFDHTSPSSAILDAANVDPVEATEPPTPGDRQMVRRGEPKQVDGVWRETWVVEDLPLPPINDLVNEERDRRVGAGFIFHGVRYQSDEVSRGRIEKAKTTALAAVVAGAQPGDLEWSGQNVDFFFIAEDDSRTPMDAQTMLAFGNFSAAWEGLHIKAGSDIKQRIASGETALDFTDDALWPSGQ